MARQLSARQITKKVGGRTIEKWSSNMASFGPPTWRAPRATNNNVTVTPCDFIEMRLMDVRIPWEPSSWTEDSERKNIFFELRDPAVRAFLQAQADAMGASNSCPERKDC